LVQSYIGLPTCDNISLRPSKGICVLKATSSIQLVQPSKCLSLLVDTTKHHIAAVLKRNEEGRVTSNIYVMVNLLPY